MVRPAPGPPPRQVQTGTTPPERPALSILRNGDCGRCGFSCRIPDVDSMSGRLPGQRSSRARGALCRGTRTSLTRLSTEQRHCERQQRGIHGLIAFYVTLRAGRRLRSPHSRQILSRPRTARRPQPRTSCDRFIVLNWRRHWFHCGDLRRGPGDTGNY